MSIEIVREVFLWCTVINYGLVLVWFLIFALGHDWMHRVHGRWFRLSAERFDAIHYAGIAMYKIGILVFNLAPYLALQLVG
ncbi:MAG TPA: hypothetical protein VGA17_00700 [Nitrospiraceae bacterium]